MAMKCRPLISSASYTTTMFGCDELGGRAGLALEARNGLGILCHALGPNDLERHHPSQPKMHGLEDLSHAAFAQKLKQPVWTQDELLYLALQQVVRLEAREPAPLHQALGQDRRLRGLGQQLRRKHLQLGRFQQLMLVQTGRPFPERILRQRRWS